MYRKTPTKNKENVIITKRKNLGINNTIAAVAIVVLAQLELCLVGFRGAQCDNVISVVILPIERRGPGWTLFVSIRLQNMHSSTSQLNSSVLDKDSLQSIKLR